MLTRKYDSAERANERMAENIWDESCRSAYEMDCLVESKIAENFSAIRTGIDPSQFIGDWIADPQSKLGEYFSEYAKHYNPDFSKIEFYILGMSIARMFNRDMRQISQSQCEE